MNNPPVESSFDAVDSINWLRTALEFKEVSKEMPPENVGVLTFHVDDLFPVCAFHVVDKDGDVHWIRIIEGSESDQPHEFLKQAPTHWSFITQ